MDSSFAFPDVAPQALYPTEKEPTPIDFAHHLSELSKRRQLSPLKGLMKYMAQPGMISMAGGLPHPSYFPFEELSAATAASDTFSLVGSEQKASAFSWLWNMFGPSKKTEDISIPKYAPKDAVQLSQALQYGMATGLPLLQTFIQQFVVKVYQPANALTQTLVHVGNTDGWAKAVLTLCNEGEGVLVEDYTYPSALATAHPVGVDPVPIKMDAEGMSAVDLEHVLATWNVSERGGMPRPHVMYTVPVGQNPTGNTMATKRKKEIYAICCKYDVIIVEDDPYYFLQVGEYVPKLQRASAASSIENMEGKEGEDAWIASLAPSYLRFDTQGRVIRLDTFSKNIAPGSRLGFFTCNPLFSERLQRAGESSTQAPCGFGQALITQLIANQWGMSGWIRWLRGIKAQYQMRRDLVLDLLYDDFDIHNEGGRDEMAGAVIMVASKKGSTMSEKSVRSEKSLFSLVPPTAGMFVWLKIHMHNHPAWPELIASGMSPAKAAAQLNYRLWVELAKNNVLFSPGWVFATDGITPDPEDELEDFAPALAAGNMEGYFRIAYSGSEPHDMKKAMGIFSKVLNKFFA